MREAFLAALLALGLGAYAQEADLLRPRVPVEGTFAAKLEVSEGFLRSMDLTEGQVADVKDEVIRLNKLREALIAELGTMRKSLDEARKTVNAVLDKLGAKEAAAAERQALLKQLATDRDKLDAAQNAIDGNMDKLRAQEIGLYDFIKQRAPADKQTNYDVRIELMPIVDWLGLSQEQLTRIIDKENQLLAGGDPRKEIVKDLAGYQPAANEAARQEQIKKLEAYRDFMKKWTDNVRSELTPEQQKLWDVRYRRTEHPLSEGL